MTSGTRQRLRQWLIAKIDSCDIEGLHWLEKSSRIFRIPWKHGGKQDWSPDHSRIFMEWARHTGKYREGIDKPEWAKWKTRLRCAFNKAPYIIELKERSDPDAADPYKVYMFKDPESSKAKSGASSQVKTKPAPEIKQEVKQEAIPAEPTIPDLDVFLSSKSGELPHDLQELRSSELMRPETLPASLSLDSNFEEMHLDTEPITGAVSEFSATMPYHLPPTRSPLQGDVPGPLPAAVTPVDVNNESFEVLPSPDSELTVLQELPTQRSLCLGDLTLQLMDVQEEGMKLIVTEESDLPLPVLGHEMHVRVQYLGNIFQEDAWAPNVVYEEWVQTKRGCRLYYGSDSDIRSVATPEAAEQMLGPAEALPILLPSCTGLVARTTSKTSSHKLEEYIQMLLDNITRGIHIECDGGDIYATRLCKCVVYFCNEDQIHSVKLQRHKRTKIFDFRIGFMSRYQGYVCNQQGHCPSTEVRLSFGQNSTYTSNARSTYISAFITSAMAVSKLKEVVPSVPLGDIEEDMQISEPDELDNQLERYRDASILPI